MDDLPKNWDKQQIKRGASFLQSSYWADFQTRLGVKPHFLNGEGWSCLLLEKRNKAGKYLFSQYGPTVESTSALSSALRYMQDYGRQLNASWLSLEPVGQNLAVKDIKQVLNQFKARVAARHREPDLTRIIDLSPDPGDLLTTISQSTRSFIRKNQREKFVSFKTSTNPDDILIFTQMLNVIAKRQNIYFYSDEYFKKQAQVLMPAGAMFLEIAIFEGQPVASALFHDYGQVSNYTYAGSLPQARQTNASALLLWQAMLNAKQRGIKKMDLYGIAPEAAPTSHPWAGFTSFKAKFGGRVVQLAGTWDFPLNNRYRLYRTAHAASKILKRR